MRSALFALVLVATACSDRDKPDLKREPERRRVIEPPPKGVRAVPPYAIRAEGVGPYKLGETVARLLDQLPSGPRITQFTLPRIVHRDILRAEDEAILIGAEPQGKAMFVAVVGGEVARTEAGVHVGSTRDELVHALGAPLDAPDRAFDPHIVIASGQKNLHSLLDEGDRITAIVVASEDRGKEVAAEGACTRPKGDRDKHQFGACLSAAGELLQYEGDEITIVGKDALKPFPPVRGLRFAAALRNPTDGRDDIVAIARTSDAQTTTWSLVAFHASETKVSRVIELQPVFQLTAANARWIGADVRDVEIYAELTSRADSIEVGGLLTTRDHDANGDKIRDIVVISPVPVPRPRIKAIPHKPDAGTDGDEPGTR